MARDTGPAGTREWSDMTEWVVDSVSDKPVGFVFDLGPRDYGPAEEEPRRKRASKRSAPK